MFRITDLKEIDFEVFLNLLLSMQVKISANEKYSSLPLEEVPEDYFGHDNFPKVKAKEIIEKLFSQSERKRLTNLMSELKTDDPLLIAKARLEKEDKLNEHKDSLTYKVFEEVKKNLPDALDLLGLIKIESNQFKESYGFLADLWTNKCKGYTTDRIKKGAVLKALEELENFIADKKNKKEKTKVSDQFEQNSIKDQDSQKVKEYCNTNQKIIEKELEKESLKEDELDAEIQNELARLKRGEINSEAEIDEIKKKISDNIKLKKVEKELDNLLDSYKQKNSSKARERLLKNLNHFIKNTSPFYQRSYQKRKTEIEKMIKQLEVDSQSQQISSTGDGFPLAAKSMISCYLFIALAIIFKNILKLRR